MGAVGSSADNAFAESLNAILKRELLAGAAGFKDELSCRREVFRWGHPLQHPPTPLLVPPAGPNTYEALSTATVQ